MWTRVKAYFNYRGEAAELEVSAAEVKQGKVFLHPADDLEHVWCIKAKAVDIFINPLEDISEADVDILDVRKVKKAEENDREPREKDADDTPRRKRERPVERTPLNHFMPKMKTFSIRLYTEEYDMVMANIRVNGYKKTEYLLACVSAAKKNSMEATYRKYTAVHKARRAADRHAAKMAQEEEFTARKNRTEADQDPAAQA